MSDTGRFKRQRRQYRQLAILLLLGSVLWVVTCGFWDLRGADECRYVQVSKELLSRNNWFLLTVNGRPYDQKPPLPFWLFALSMKVVGGRVSNYAVRMPSVLFGILTVTLIYLIGCHMLGCRAGFVAALVFMTSPLVHSNVSQARLDMMFTGWITLSLFAWLTRPEYLELSLERAVLMWTALIGAFFTKGPLAVIIVVSVVLTEAWSSSRWREYISISRMLPGLIILIIAVGWWLNLERYSAGGSFVMNQVKGQTVTRFLKGAHYKPLWFYVPDLFTHGMGIWAFVLIPLAARILNKKKRIPSRLTPLFGWFLPTFVLLCVAHGKRSCYVLPLLPGLSLLVGWQIDVWMRTGKKVRKITVVFGVLVGLISVLLILVALLAVFNPTLLQERSLHFTFYHPLLLLVAASLLLYLSLMMLRRHDMPVMALSYNLAMVLFIFFFLDYTVFRPAVNWLHSSRHFTETIENNFPELRRGGCLGGVGRLGRAKYHVYSHYRLVQLPVKNPFASKSLKNLPKYLVVRSEDLSPILSQLLSVGFRKEALKLWTDEMNIILLSCNNKTRACFTP